MKTALRWILITEWLLIFSSAGFGIALEETLPAELQEWVSTEGSSVSDSQAVCYIIVVLGLIISTVGLFFAKRWAAWLYIVSTLCAIFSVWSPSVQNPAEAILDDMSLVASGLVIGVCFFSGILISKKEPNQPLQRNASTGSVSDLKSPARRG